MSKEYPPALRAWLQRSLGGLTPKQTSLAQAELKEVVKAVMGAGVLWKVNWDTQPPHRLGDVQGTVADIIEVDRKPPAPPSAAAAAASYQPPPTPLMPPVATSYYPSAPAASYYPPAPAPSYYPPAPPNYVQQHYYQAPSAPLPFATNTNPANLVPPPTPSSIKVSQYQPAEKRTRFSQAVEVTPAFCAKALLAYMQRNHLATMALERLPDFVSQIPPEQQDAVAAFTQSTSKLQSVCSASQHGQLKFVRGRIELSNNSESSSDKIANTFTLDEDAAVIAARAARFASIPPPPSHQAASSAQETDAATAPGEILQGTCTVLEKSYLRTSSEAPHASTVRPQPILELALERILAKLSAERNTAYAWANDQLRAIRQDLKFQHIENEFAVRVYESHARSAIEYGGPDLAELNTCLTQLKEISTLQPEFASLHLLYHAYCMARYRAKSSQVVFALQPSLPTRNNPEQARAYDIVLALHERNWHKYLTLVFAQGEGGTTALERALLRPVTDFVRLAYAQTMCACAGKSLPLANVRRALFSRCNPSQQQQAEDFFFSKFNFLVLVEGSADMVDAKLTLARLQQVLQDGLCWQ